jgi:hypothetical protein
MVKAMMRSWFWGCEDCGWHLETIDVAVVPGDVLMVGEERDE